MRSAALVRLMLGLVAAPGDVAEGVRLYDAGSYAEALGALTRSLTQKASANDHARAHLYIGLIQIQFQHPEDARASFSEALERDPAIRLPPAAPKEARSMFAQLLQAKKPRRARARPTDRTSEVHVADTATAPPSLLGAVQVEPPPAEPPPPPALPAISDPSPPPIEHEVAVLPEEHPTSWFGWTALGGGTALIGTGGVLGALALASHAKAGRATFADDAQAAHQTAVSEGSAAAILLGAGAVAVGAGVVLLLSD